jgi:Ubiquitin-conjugating enzyme
MNPVQKLRLQADKEQITKLCSTAPFAGKVQLLAAATALQPRWRFRLNIRTVANAQFPDTALQELELEIRFGSQYPFQAPTAHLAPIPFHPNVFASGVICLGNKWSASEGLDLLVQRIVRLLTFDPLLVNIDSPANSQAARWYQAHKRQFPASFPSDVLSATAPRVPTPCPQCQVKLGLPAGRSGEVQCPRCSTVFMANT